MCQRAISTLSDGVIWAFVFTFMVHEEVMFLFVWRIFILFPTSVYSFRGLFLVIFLFLVSFM